MSKLHRARHRRAPSPHTWDARGFNPPSPHYSQQAPYAGQPQPPNQDWPPHPLAPVPKKRHRVFFWIFLAVQIAFLIWVITGIASNDNMPAECSGLTGSDLQLCKDAADVGTTIGVGLIIGLWAAVDFILALTYVIYRLASRQPRA
ncbi:hypothetical protein [Streptomyces sp. 8N706]|uniref:hypothetical protein n=1 Tax=Streptomyces sp. 8N706 TaxID=3457416 RepID=UPI003FD65EFE